MSFLPVILSVFAMLHTPAVPVYCVPTLGTNTLGETFVYTGGPQNNKPSQVELVQWVCDGLEYASGNAQTRARIAPEFSGPGDRLDQNIGAAIHTLVHEATHVTLFADGLPQESSNECLVERLAWKRTPGFIARYLHGNAYKVALASAKQDSQTHQHQYC